MAIQQIRAEQIKNLSITDAQISASAAIALSKLATGGSIMLNNAIIEANNQRIQNVSTPINTNDAANKAYVDATSQGLVVKSAVRVATTANITLSGTQTIDGIALSANDRVLVKNQSTASENGIYIVNAGAWTRATDADTTGELGGGTFVFVQSGTANDNSGWVITNDTAITIGSTAINWEQFSGAGQITAGAGLTKTGNSLDVIAGDDSILVTANAIQAQHNSTGGTETVAGGIQVKLVANKPLFSGAGGLDIRTGFYTYVNGSYELDLNVGRFYYNITPAGLVNGSNAVFTLPTNFVGGSTCVYLNGIREAPANYTEGINTITMVTAPLTGDIISVDYIESL